MFLEKILKTGDNISHNVKILSVLYKQYEIADSDEKNLLCKPIILTIVSIIEACLHDFYFRIRVHTVEGISNLNNEIIEEIRASNVDEFSKYIKNAKKHDLFNLKGLNFYDRLDDLRKLRNRVHIQNIWGLKPLNENEAFTDKEKILAEKVLEVVMKTLSGKHIRTEYTAGYVDDFMLSWDEYFE